MTTLQPTGGVMDAKKPTLAAPRTARKPLSVLERHSGALKMFANYGFAGLAFGYLLVFTIPEAQKAHNSSLEKLSAENREDRKAAFEHGDKAVERIANSIDGLRGSWSDIQQKTQSNQRELIQLQSKTVELMQKQNQTTNE